MLEDKALSFERKTWLSGDIVCHLLGISKRTLQNYRDRNIIPFSQAGRKIYYKAEDIDEYLERHYIKASYQQNREGNVL